MKSNFYKIGLLVTIFVIFGFFIFQNLAEIERTFNVTTKSLTIWILLAFGLGIFSYFFVIKTDQKAFEMVKVKIPFWRMARLNLSALAANVLIPSAGVSGGLVFVEDARKNGYTPSSAVAGTILYILSDYSAITLLLAASLIYLLAVHSLNLSTLVPISVFLVLTGSFYLLLYLSYRQSRRARRVLSALLSPVFWLISLVSKKQAKTKESVDGFFTELCYASQVIKTAPQNLAQAVSWAFVGHLFKLGSLYLLFYSFGFHINPSILLAGYIIGIVVMIVSPTPNGIGFVEGAMVVLFVGFKIPRELATTATLIFRGYAFWIPFFVGLFLLQTDRIKKIRDDMAKLNSTSLDQAAL